MWECRRRHDAPRGAATDGQTDGHRGDRRGWVLGDGVVEAADKELVSSAADERGSSRCLRSRVSPVLLSSASLQSRRSSASASKLFRHDAQPICPQLICRMQRQVYPRDRTVFSSPANKLGRGENSVLAKGGGRFGVGGKTTGGLGDRSPQRGPGAEPGRGSGEQSPPKAKEFLK